MNMEILLEKTEEIISRFNQVEGWLLSSATKDCFRESLESKGILEFGAFACPPISARMLFEQNPERYILTSSTSTSLSKGGNDQRVNKLFRSLREVGAEPTLQVIIGDSDEEDYVFPVVPPPLGLDPINVEERRQQFYLSYKDYLSQLFPWKLEVNRYSEIASLFDDEIAVPNLNSDFIKRDLNEEANQMSYFFGPNEYYDGLKCPSTDELLKMAELKFIAYAWQGRRLKEMFPTMIIIQNEFPLLLRTSMLNLLNTQLGAPLLPAIYPIKDRWSERKNG